MGRTLPMECEHGVTIDWGDFGPCQGNCERVHPEDLDDCPDFERCLECARTTHVFTDAELRARDERIIRAAWRESGVPTGARSSDFDAIIAAAEAEDQ